MKSLKTYFRPLFTCGAYNRQARRAVMYNTARGTCYTFEDVKALRELAEWPVPLNLKTPVFRKKIRC